MKYVHPTDMVAHLWANESQSEARNSANNVFFRDSTIYSYGSHFPMARHVERKGKKCVLMTTDTYSSTTAGHCSMVRGAIRPGTMVFNVPDIFAESHKANLADYSKRITADAIAVKRARLQGEWKHEWLVKLVREANQYAEFFGLKTRFTIPDIDLKAIRERAQAERKKRDKELTRQREQQEQRQAARQLELAEIASQWQAGNVDTMPHDFERVLLRVRGSHLQTSKGAVVELESAKRLLPIIRRGTNWERNGQTIQVGDFQVDRIDSEGNCHIGCHYIDRTEINRVATLLGI